MSMGGRFTNGMAQDTGNLADITFATPSYTSAPSDMSQYQAMPSGMNGANTTAMPSSGGKGGATIGMPPAVTVMPQYMPQPVPFYMSEPSMQMQNFNNAGRLTDSTLLAQQGILGRAPTQYQPLLTPANYIDFYLNTQARATPANNLVVPEYRRPPDPVPTADQITLMNIINSGGGEAFNGDFGGAFGLDAAPNIGYSGDFGLGGPSSGNTSGMGIGGPAGDSNSGANDGSSGVAW